MPRRTLLAAAGIALPVLATGCTSDSSRSAAPAVPLTRPVLHVNLALGGAVAGRGAFVLAAGALGEDCTTLARQGTLPGATGADEFLLLPDPGAAAPPGLAGPHSVSVAGAIRSYAGPRSYQQEASGLDSVAVDRRAPTDLPHSYEPFVGLTTASAVVNADGSGRLDVRHLYPRTQEKTSSPDPKTAIDVSEAWVCRVEAAPTPPPTTPPPPASTTSPPSSTRTPGLSPTPTRR